MINKNMIIKFLIADTVIGVPLIIRSNKKREQQNIEERTVWYKIRTVKPPNRYVVN